MAEKILDELEELDQLAEQRKMPRRIAFESEARWTKEEGPHWMWTLEVRRQIDAWLKSNRGKPIKIIFTS